MGHPSVPEKGLIRIDSRCRIGIDENSATFLSGESILFSVVMAK